MMNKKQNILTIISLLLVASGLFAVYQYQKSHQQAGTIQEENSVFAPIVPKGEFCNIPPHYPLAKNTTIQTTPWITYHNKEFHYRFDYLSILVSNPDALPPDVEFGNFPFQIDVAVSSTDVVSDPDTLSSNVAPLDFPFPINSKVSTMGSYPYQRSLDTYVQYVSDGERLEKRIKIDGYDAIVTSLLPDREDKSNVLLTHIIKDKTFFTIRTQCVDHERVWNSFKFE